MNNFKIHISKVSLPSLVRLLLLCLIILNTTLASAQSKKIKRIKIEEADMLLSDETVIENAKRLVGNVILSHNNMIMKCDSAWAYTTTNSVDAFGNVHIISNDTLNLWAEFINYNGNTSFAYARKNVKLEDPSLTLFTDSLDFDMNEEIGYYNYGGKIIDSTNVLNSKIGRYYSKTSTVHFIENVRLKNEDYTLRTDTLLYNTDTEIVSFDGPTRIIGDSTNIYSTLGWFNTKTQESELNENSTIRRGETQLQGDYIHYNDANKEGIAKGNVVINDYEKQMIIAGNNAIYDDFDQYAIVTDSAMWVQYYEDDSLFLHADTLYTIPDTSMAGQKMLIAYNNVRFFRSDMQGISDSLIYFSKDSTIQLFSDPVIWSNENQLTAEFIEFRNNAEPPNEVYLNENSFIIQQNDSSKFNQIKGKNMVGLINGQILYRINVNGNGQSIYFPVDDKEYIGINKAESSNITLYLSDNQINRITFIGSPVGIMKPLIEQVSPESQLDGFNWRIKERPTNRYDIFGNKANAEEYIELPKTEIENKIASPTEANNEIEAEEQ